MPSWRLASTAARGWGVRVGRRKARKTLAGWQPFVFVSVFKWEHRKGWDLLLRG